MKKLTPLWILYARLRAAGRRKPYLYVRGLIELKLFLRRRIRLGRVYFFFNDPQSLRAWVYGVLEMKFVALPLGNVAKDQLMSVVLFVWDFSSPLAKFSMFFLFCVGFVYTYFRFVRWLQYIALYDFFFFVANFAALFPL